MNEKSLTPEDIKEISEVFEKTLLEISILDTLYGGSDVSDYVKNVFRTSMEELHRFGSLKTLDAIVDDGAERKRGENRRKEMRLFGLHGHERELRPQKCTNDEPRTGQHASVDNNLDLLKQKQEEIDLIIEQCTEDGERTAMRRETEKNYVDKWERARVENFKLQFRAEELELQREIKELRVKLESEQIVDAENEKFLDHSINELEKQIIYWENKYTTDIIEVNEKLENLLETLKEKTKEGENFKNTFNERQTIIEEHAKDKQKVEEEKRINSYREKMATKIQAWWRGTMVRRRLGPYKLLLGPRKKSIKKPIINKGKKMKDK